MDNLMYELMIIVKTSLSEDAEKKVLNEVKDLVSVKGKIDSQEKLGRKTLAYRIKKETEGNYWILNLNSDPEGLKTLNTKLGLNENILRFLLLKKVIQSDKKAGKAAKAKAQNELKKTEVKKTVRRGK